MSREKQNLQQQADRAGSRSSRSVMNYLVILFAAAFVLLLLSYFMQQRTNEAAIDNLQQSSHSASQTLNNLIADRDRLNEEVDNLEDQLTKAREDLSHANSATESALADASLAKTRSTALLHLAQLQSLYDQGSLEEARELMARYPALQTQLEELSANGLTPVDRAIYDPLQAYLDLADALN